VCYEDPMHHSSLSGFLSLHGKYFNSSKWKCGKGVLCLPQPPSWQLSLLSGKQTYVETYVLI
jgi:hypothetical protein